MIIYKVTPISSRLESVRHSPMLKLGLIFLLSISVVFVKRLNLIIHKPWLVRCIVVNELVTNLCYSFLVTRQSVSSNLNWHL